MGNYTYPITYEECGVLGGRTLFRYGQEFRLHDDQSIIDFAGKLVVEAQEIYQEGFIYPFQRIAVCLITQEDGAIFAFTDENDFGEGTFSYFTISEQEFELTTIETLLSVHNIQIYDILLQISPSTWKVIQYGGIVDKAKYGYAYDIFRCLDIRGACLVKKITENAAFHNYVRYDLGEDYYVEAYDNSNTGSREFWMGREFMKQKFLITAFDFDDTDYHGLFDDMGKLCIDEQIADLICKLSDKHEYIFINNDYILDMRGLRMDGDEERFNGRHIAE